VRQGELLRELQPRLVERVGPGQVGGKHVRPVGEWVAVRVRGVQLAEARAVLAALERQPRGQAAQHLEVRLLDVDRAVRE
jgi:hypothetical protein